MIDLQNEYKQVLVLNKDLSEYIASATKYKVSGRTDMARMYLSRVRWEVSKLNYQTHLIARDIATWYQDYFILKEQTDNDAKVKESIEAQQSAYKEAFKLIDQEREKYEFTRDQIVGPAMLIFGILFSICGLVGVVYYIRRMQKHQNKEMFGLNSSRSDKNDMMIKYYTQNPDGEEPTRFLQRLQESNFFQLIFVSCYLK